MKGTGIQWADDTVNPTTGCDGCELWIPGRGGPCYAGNLHESRLALSLPNLYAPNFDEVRYAPGRMRKIANCMSMEGKDRPAKPWLNGRRRLIFLGDLGDIFSKAIEFDYLRTELIDIAKSSAGARHDWLCLTKQPQRAVQFAAWLGEWPDNIWVGTSITGKASLRRLDHLKNHPAKYRFLSVEPQIEDVDLSPSSLDGVSWVIQGGESSQREYAARPFNVEWVRCLRSVCQKAGVAYFLKQLGGLPFDGERRLCLKDGHGGDWMEWDEDLRVRELPQ